MNTKPSAANSITPPTRGHYATVYDKRLRRHRLEVCQHWDWTDISDPAPSLRAAPIVRKRCACGLEWREVTVGSVLP